MSNALDLAWVRCSFRFEKSFKSVLICDGVRSSWDIPVRLSDVKIHSSVNLLCQLISEFNRRLDHSYKNNNKQTKTKTREVNVGSRNRQRDLSTWGHCYLLFSGLYFELNWCKIILNVWFFPEVPLCGWRDVKIQELTTANSLCRSQERCNSSRTMSEVAATTSPTWTATSCWTSIRRLLPFLWVRSSFA